MTIDIRECCDACRSKVERLMAAGFPLPFATFIADPLMSVNLRDREWAAKFDAAHPRRAHLALPFMEPRP